MPICHAVDGLFIPLDVWRGALYHKRVIKSFRDAEAEKVFGRRLARYFGTSPQFWLGLQRDYDLDVAADLLGDRLTREVRVMEKREDYG